MSVTVTLHIYSGLPDPAWELSQDQIADLRSIIASSGQRSLLKPPGLFGKLGYRGFTIDSVGEPGLETSMYVHAGVLDIGRYDLSIVTDEPALEDFLLSTSPLDPGLADIIKRDLTTQSLQDFRDQILDEPPYDPGKWNNDPNIRTRNNCYNYANDKITNTFAQPGRGSGSVGPYPPNCSGTGGAAERDRLNRIANPSMTPAEGQIVALVIADQPNFKDYHWYRRDANGRWSHKPGQTPARNTDNAGQSITNPETCNRGPYTIFCGYYHSIPTATIIN